MSEKAHVDRLLEKERLLNRIIEPCPVTQVGEMRDAETAPTGLEASLTGHLVLSILHTNSAPETIARLIDMGMNPLNFSDALLAILAQRLVRTVCPDCKEPYHPNQGEVDVLVEEYDRELFAELSRASYACPNELAEAASR